MYIIQQIFKAYGLRMRNKDAEWGNKKLLLKSCVLVGVKVKGKVKGKVKVKVKETKNFNFLFGGGDRDRTDGLLRARQMLSQLSYTPMVYFGGPSWTWTRDLTLIRRAL